MGGERHDRTIRITNSFAEMVVFCVEPWGDEIPLPAGGSFHVRAEGPPQGELEVQVAAGRVTVWGWPGSTLSVFRPDGTQVDHPGRPRVPDVPPGMTTRGFLNVVFGSDEPRPRSGT